MAITGFNGYIQNDTDATLYYVEGDAENGWDSGQTPPSSIPPHSRSTRFGNSDNVNANGRVVYKLTVNGAEATVQCTWNVPSLSGNSYSCSTKLGAQLPTSVDGPTHGNHPTAVFKVG